jgi:hypothetical protein
LHAPAAKTGINPENIVGTGGTPITTYLGSRHQTTQNTVTELGKKELEFKPIRAKL